MASHSHQNSMPAGEPAVAPDAARPSHDPTRTTRISRPRSSRLASFSRGNSGVMKKRSGLGDAASVMVASSGRRSRGKRQGGDTRVREPGVARPRWPWTVPRVRPGGTPPRRPLRKKRGRMCAVDPRCSHGVTEPKLAPANELPVLAELLSLTPRIIARIAPPRWRDELVQQVLCDCWLAMRNGADIRSAFDYVRTAARRAFARVQRRGEPAGLRFDSPFVDHVSAPDARQPGPDLGPLRARLKAVLDDRHRAIYENHYERGLGIRATARACGCDRTQVRRCLAHISNRGCAIAPSAGLSRERDLR